MHKTGETVAVRFAVSDPATGGLVNADSLPTAVLLVNGVVSAATVTVASVSTGRYTASVTLPTITDGDLLQIDISATAGVLALWEEPEPEVDETKGVQTQHVDRVWIVGRTAYVIGGLAVLPAPGDRITDAAGDVWEVMRDGRKPHYAPYGTDRWSLRTKRVG